MKKDIPKANVNAYLAALPPKDRATLKKLRRAIKAAAPKAEERISYGMPGYYQSGPVVFFAAFKDHLSFFAGYTILKTFAKDFGAFKIKGTTVHFSANHSLPMALVRKVVLRRIRENLERVKLKSKPTNRPTKSR